MHKVIVIVGPTSSGKTALSIEVARAVGGEVISADSRQVYKGLDLGTGKVTKTEMKGVRHHLLDIASPKRVFTAADFVKKGRSAIESIVKRGHVPIICGGTGFYIDALLGTISVPNVAPNKALRAELEKHDAPALYEQLKTLDPSRASTIDSHNPVRLIRAIEIASALGSVPPPASTPLYDVLWVGIKPDAEILSTKIHTRLLARMRRGMLAEGRRLHAAGLSFRRMEALGLEYRHMARHLQGMIDKETLIKELEADINAYVKRQYTYWRRNPDIHWLVPGADASDVVQKALREIHTFLPLRKS